MALFGVMLLVIGVRLYNNGLVNCGYQGVLSYGTFDTVAADEIPLLVSGTHRIDIYGNEQTALDVIDNLSGKLLWSESVGDALILYAYSPRLSKAVVVHGQEVNLMIAVSPRGVAAGTPLLYGSY